MEVIVGSFIIAIVLSILIVSIIFYPCAIYIGKIENVTFGKSILSVTLGLMADFAVRWIIRSILYPDSNFFVVGLTMRGYNNAIEIIFTSIAYVLVVMLVFNCNWLKALRACIILIIVSAFFTFLATNISPFNILQGISNNLGKEKNSSEIISNITKEFLEEKPYSNEEEEIHALPALYEAAPNDWAYITLFINDNLTFELKFIMLQDSQVATFKGEVVETERSYFLECPSVTNFSKMFNDKSSNTYRILSDTEVELDKYANGFIIGGVLCEKAEEVKNGNSTIKGTNVNIRSSPMLGDNVIIQVNEGQIGTILQKGYIDIISGHIDFWYKVRFGNGEGWVFGYYTDKRMKE